MRTKKEILEDLNSISHPIKNIGDIQHDIIKVEVLLDIRDVMADDNIYIEKIAKTLEDIAEPIKYIANNQGGNF